MPPRLSERPFFLSDTGGKLTGSWFTIRDGVSVGGRDWTIAFSRLEVAVPDDFNEVQLAANVGTPRFLCGFRPVDFKFDQIVGLRRGTGATWALPGEALLLRVLGGAGITKPWTVSGATYLEN